MRRACTSYVMSTSQLHIIYFIKIIIIFVFLIIFVYYYFFIFLFFLGMEVMELFCGRVGQKC